MRIVFMGTPDIAATCLNGVLSEGFQVVGVYTQPDRPKNRGMKLVYSPVKEVAIANDIPVYQPESFKDPEVVNSLKALQPDVIAVVAYGRILPQSVLDIPGKGCINIHASILPSYRGSAPYQWAVLDGLKETGVTAMYLCREMDAGDIIDISKTDIGEDETAGELLDRLAVLGAELLNKTLHAIEVGSVSSVPQDSTKATYAPMLDKTMCPIDWNKTAKQIHDHVRGMNPWPVATTEIAGKRFKIYDAVAVSEKHSVAPGTIVGLTKTGLQIACSDGTVEIRVLQAEGGKRMCAPDYFRGHPLEL